MAKTEKQGQDQDPSSFTVVEMMNRVLSSDNALKEFDPEYASVTVQSPDVPDSWYRSNLVESLHLLAPAASIAFCSYLICDFSLSFILPGEWITAKVILSSVFSFFTLGLHLKRSLQDFEFRLSYLKWILQLQAKALAYSAAFLEDTSNNKSSKAQRFRDLKLHVINNESPAKD